MLVIPILFNVVILSFQKFWVYSTLEILSSIEISESRKSLFCPIQKFREFQICPTSKFRGSQFCPVSIFSNPESRFYPVLKFLDSMRFRIFYRYHIVLIGGHDMSYAAGLESQNELVVLTILYDFFLATIQWLHVFDEIS